MSDELTIADIQQAFFEYRANFKQPLTGLWYGGKQGEIIKALLKALSPWHVGLENVTWNQTAKNASEIQLTILVPSMVTNIQVGLGGLTMNALNPDWSRTPQFVSLFQTGLDALRATAQEEFQAQQTTLGFHVKPSKRPFRDILTGLVNTKALGGEDASMFGVSVYYGDYSFVIDGSAVFPGSVFIKLIRNFAPEKQFEEMAKTLYADEETVLHKLGLKLQ
jgi:hypothetical protein